MRAARSTGVVFLGLVVALLLAGHIARPDGPTHAGDPRPETVFAVNKNGQTYGPTGNLPEGAPLPDLVEAFGDGGIRGYVLSEDLRGPVLSPEEVLELPVVTTEEGATVFQEPAREIPLYAVDGTTVIGTFTLS